MRRTRSQISRLGHVGDDERGDGESSAQSLYSEEPVQEVNLMDITDNPMQALDAKLAAATHQREILRKQRMLKAIEEELHDLQRSPVVLPELRAPALPPGLISPTPLESESSFVSSKTPSGLALPIRLRPLDVYRGRSLKEHRLFTRGVETAFRLNP